MEYLLDFRKIEYNHTYGTNVVPYYIYIASCIGKIDLSVLNMSVRERESLCIYIIDIDFRSLLVKSELVDSGLGRISGAV